MKRLRIKLSEEFEIVRRVQQTVLTFLFQINILFLRNKVGFKNNDIILINSLIKQLNILSTHSFTKKSNFNEILVAHYMVVNQYDQYSFQLIDSFEVSSK